MAFHEPASKVAIYALLIAACRKNKWNTVNFEIVAAYLPLFIFCGFIFIQSSYPSPNTVITFAFSDKLLHVLAYAVLGILFFRAYGTLPLRNNLSLLIGLSILSAGLFGLSDEIHQYFVPARNTDLWDLIADIIGSLLGVFLYQAWTFRKEPD